MDQVELLYEIKKRASINLMEARCSRRTKGNYTLLRLLLIVLNVLPMSGPRTNKAAITIMATRTRISAYSTKPWPLSFGANNIMKYSPFFWISLNNPEYVKYSN